MCFRLLFAAVLLGLTWPLHSQKLVSPNNLWYLTQKGYPTGQGGGDTLNFSVFFKDSVLINGHYYYKLESSLGESERSWLVPKLFFREKDRAVYHLNEDGSETILYDFKLQVGDSILYKVPRTQNYIKVVAIDSVTMQDGSKRKRLRVQGRGYDGGTNAWIEGIGNQEFPFYQHYLFLIDAYTWWPRCFFVKQQFFHGYLSNKSNCDTKLGFFASSNRQLKALEDLEILQNTPDGHLRFRLALPGQYVFQVFNLQGALIAANTAGQGENEFILNTAAKGLFLFRILDLENRKQVSIRLQRH